MLTDNNSRDPRWFGDVPAWEPSGGQPAPATALADAVREAGLVGVDRQPVDEWGWLDAEPDAAAADPAPAAVPATGSDADTAEPAEDDARALSTPPADPAPPAPTRARRRRRRGGADRARRANVMLAGWVAATLLVAAALGGVAGLLLRAGDAPAGGESAAAPPAAVSSSSPPGGAAGGECPSGTDGAVTRGRDRGGQGSGPDAIKAFYYAYYTLRDARAAQAVTAKSMGLNPDTMQGFIDRRPPGTTYCLTITDRGRGVFAVRLVETPPDGSAPAVFSQITETTRATGKTWIAANRAVD